MTFPWPRLSSWLVPLSRVPGDPHPAHGKLTQRRHPHRRSGQRPQGHGRADCTHL